MTVEGRNTERLLMDFIWGKIPDNLGLIINELEYRGIDLDLIEKQISELIMDIINKNPYLDIGKDI